jgi:hypothetical protein
MEAVKPEYTGADLYSATRKCIDEGQYEMLASLFSLGGTYGRFDIERIADKHARFCAQVVKVGPPAYIPTYLISHGIGRPEARRVDKDGLDGDFDRNRTWENLLSDGLLCPKQ